MARERLEELRLIKETQDKRCADEEELRMLDRQTRRDEANARREAEERRERLRNMQLPPPMSAKADVKEYLEIFENIAERKELRAQDWAPTIIPLLNDRFRGTALKLPRRSRQSMRSSRRPCWSVMIITSRTRQRPFGRSRRTEASRPWNSANN